MKLCINKKQQVYTEIDDEDYNRIIDSGMIPSIAKSGKYAALNKWYDGKNHKIYLHRFLMNAQPEQLIDHINGDTLDNRKSNLRYCDYRENAQHRIRKSNKQLSRYKGVAPRQLKNEIKYIAYIFHNKKRKYLGIYKTEEEAARVYNIAAIKYFKEFAWLNVID